MLFLPKLQVALILSAITLSFSVHAQTPFFVFDSERAEPVPFCEVRTSDGHELTDWNGMIVLSDSSGSVSLHALGFVDTIYAQLQDTLWIRPSHIVLREAMVYGGDEEPDLRLGNPSDDTEISLSVARNLRDPFQMGLFIPIDEPTVIHAVQLYSASSSEEGSYFRLRLYHAQTEEGRMITSDMLDSTYIGVLECDDCWQKLALPKPVIVENSLMVAIEWIPDPEWTQEVDEINHGMSCAFSEDGRDCHTYKRIRRAGDETEWILHCFESLPNLKGDKRVNLALYLDAHSLRSE